MEQQCINVIYSRRRFNPFSWLIRWSIPRSRFAMALASHCAIQDGDYIIEASMLHGVRRVPTIEALKGVTIIKEVAYIVPDMNAGLSWARNQVGAAYDWPGAFGVALDVDRSWQKSDSWFCFELAAGALKAAGKDVFADQGHITGNVLMSIKP